jgi:hypothetical protein
MRRKILVLAILSLTGCVSELGNVAPCDLTCDLLGHLHVESISHHETLVEGSLLVVRGESFLDEPLCVVPEVVISGTLNNEQIELTLEPEILSSNDLVVMVPAELFGFTANTADLEGTLEVRYSVIDDGRVYAAARDLSATLVRELIPSFDGIEQSEVYLNDPITVEGANFLDGQREGSTHVVLDGWYETVEETAERSTTCRSLPTSSSFRADRA